MSRLLHIATLATLSVVGPLSGLAQITIPVTELPTPSATSSPQGIDSAPDGSVWYCETAAGRIAQLKPNQSTVEFSIPNGGQPFIAKFSSDGIWFTYANRPAIGHLNAATGAVEQFTVPSGSSVFFIQIAADGSKWFSESAGVGRLAPNGTITEWSFPQEHADDNIEQIGIDSSGNIWSAERNFDGAGAAGTNSVRRLNPATNVVSTYLVPTFGGNPAGIQTNPDGTVWVSEYFANDFALLFPSIARHTDAFVTPNAILASATTGASARTAPIRPAAATTKEAASLNFVKPSFTQGWIEFPIPTANAQAEDMRVDQYGKLWFEEDNGKLGNLAPVLSLFTEITVPSANSGYYNITLNKGQLYFTEAGLFAPVPSKVGFLPIQ